MISYIPLHSGDLHKEINRHFNKWSNCGNSNMNEKWIPLVNMAEYADRFLLSVDLPGIMPESINITINNGVLTIAGERKNAIIKEHEKKTVYYRPERKHGNFCWRFSIPSSVDTDKIKASSDNGVLKIVIPKQAKAQPQRIDVAA